MSFGLKRFEELRLPRPLLLGGFDLRGHGAAKQPIER
jgi:hypothetical protein